MNNVVIMKDCSKASEIDLKRLLMSVDNILIAHQQINEKMNRAPIAIRVYIDENEGKIESLNMMRMQIVNELR